MDRYEWTVNHRRKQYSVLALNGVDVCPEDVVKEIKTLARELAKERKFNQDMVAKIAENRLDGYRELGQKLAHCEARLAKEEARVEELEKGLNAVHELINDSYGVTGLHLNGDTAKWSELLEGGRYEEWLVDFSKALNRGIGE